MLDYESWEQAVPRAIANDALWQMRVYRLALFIGDLGWADVTRLIQDRRTIALADQLYRAVGSIGANLAEGYSKSSGRDRAHFYEYSLGSALESRDWFYKARFVLGDDISVQRMELLTQIIRLTLTMLPGERTRTLREDTSEYESDHE
jgi:four helix bundle protein